jgi:very-short-patch-repair endonuclease
LVAKIGEERIEQQYKIGGFRIDLVIKSKITMKPIIAIECDGAEYHSSNEAYAWDIFRESVIKPYGFIFFRIWSTNWWYSAERELNILVEFIDRLDREEYEKINLPQNEITLNDLFGDGNKTLN